MCGIAGFFLTSSASDEQLSKTAYAMIDTINHRGPDSNGMWADNQATLALGHCRLAIIDLTAAGRQPMSSASGRWVIVFNGEIYNHKSIRTELELTGSAPTWNGDSDTETLLAAVEYWGIEAALRRSVGMFSFALWDNLTRVLVLARDRFGEKPLYYGWAGEGTNKAMLFGSELKALKAFPGFGMEVCRQALAQYLRFMYVPAPRSIYSGIYKLEPGCLLWIRGIPPRDPPSNPLRPGQSYGSISLQRWWSLSSETIVAAQAPITKEAEAIEMLEYRLNEAVAIQSIADVSLGAFLSGGVDSSTIVALLQRTSSLPVKTFTIGFDEVGFDESHHALSVARHLGTDHYETQVTAKMVEDVIPLLPEIYDEPFADSSQIPTYIVSKAARQKVTVALSGDAGDELFGGYNRYFWGQRIWSRVSWMPIPVRRAIGSLLNTVPISMWNLASVATNIESGKNGVTRFGENAHKLGRRLQTVRNIDDLYRSLVSAWEDPAALVRGESGGRVFEPLNLIDDSIPVQVLEQDQLRMMYWDTMTYLPDDILCKVDRAAMANGLETRVPFLDHRVVELALRLPVDMKIRNNVGKWILREVLYKYVPKHLIERPKAGFAIPIGQWLRGPLRQWAEALLQSSRIEQDGYLRPEPIREAWLQHQRGTHDHSAKLWAVLMFQAWIQHQSMHKK